MKFFPVLILGHLLFAGLPVFSQTPVELFVGDKKSTLDIMYLNFFRNSFVHPTRISKRLSHGRKKSVPFHTKSSHRNKMERGSIRPWRGVQ